VKTVFGNFLKSLATTPARLLVLTIGCNMATSNAADIAQIDLLTAQWLNLAKQSAQLKKSWQQQQPILLQQHTLLTAEKYQLSAIIDTDNESSKDIDIKRKTLLKDQTQLEQQQQQFAQQFALLNTKLSYLRHLLPPPLVKSWQQEQQVLTAEADLSLQLQVALAQLSSLAEFEQRISLHEMPLIAPSGKEVLVKQLYLGLGIAWFTSANGKYRGWGQANNTVWQWHFDEHTDAEEIKRAIAIFEKKSPADFVELPVKLSKHITPQALSPVTAPAKTTKEEQS